MSEKGYKRFLPSFITIVFELFEHLARHSAHSSNVKKLDKTAEQLGTIENLLVKLEKKVQVNRDLIERLKLQLTFSLIVNVVFMLVILLKVLGYF